MYFKRNIEALSRNHYIFRVWVLVNLYSMQRTCAILHYIVICAVSDPNVFFNIIS
jgi:hypothetical protein